ncbi:hypothetical protein EWM64_g175 [Hericium alpestre]|uniref:Uncharacterized protein n=1 Tax=Hericium alpestre TaxID=135208 RepID=A0A4Z0ABY4_9AGAM|nr:hypothetical protein EWM64_g175 [Hericium alpestre]
MSTIRQVARRIPRRTPNLIRYTSSQSDAPTPAPSAPEFRLSPAKLRALISLYHESGSFITPQNLDDVIDKVFTNENDVYTTTRGQKYKSYMELRAEVQARRTAPKFVQAAQTAANRTNSFSEANERLQQVAGALFGTEKEKEIGLELLQDRWEVTESRLKETENDDWVAEESGPEREWIEKMRGRKSGL